GSCEQFRPQSSPCAEAGMQALTEGQTGVTPSSSRPAGAAEGAGRPPLQPGGVKQGGKRGLVLNSLPLADSPVRARSPPPSLRIGEGTSPSPSEQAARLGSAPRCPYAGTLRSPVGGQEVEGRATAGAELLRAHGGWADPRRGSSVRLY
ncbi:unnamed protein product, partial [Coccothraustes coccothraustes]